ncbi:NAD(P)-binding protein [Myriangium duriaei CBS 260.36]|uniref:NAD(P)-binding protein n=1 Tax=Myriangium duriaei CBS 260.36 TaxID=1168546 RepID=A0A9P4JBW4_9PEZI|nr:NAD(P)-binding protein [Myriangium duriaei CBS 260.36]
MSTINKSTFDPERDIPDLSGKVILITGGNTGLGFETLRHLARHNPSHIYLAARSASKADAAIASIREETPSAPPITHIPLDLSSFSSVKSAAETFTSASPRLDILINNAGIMNSPYSLTPEGYEVQFGTNHMGPALLTHLLLPTLLRTAEDPNADVRVVNLTSEAYKMAQLSGGLCLDPTKSKRYFTMVRYGGSKLANMLHARALGRKYPQITAVSVHPGVIDTQLFDSSRALWKKIPLVGGALAGWMTGRLGTVADGARNQLWAATAEREKVRSGFYFTPVGVKDNGNRYSSQEHAEKLWVWTEGELKKHGY